MAVDPKHPLAKFVDGSKTQTTFRVPPMPNLPELVTQHGFKGGIAAHHEAMMEWSKNLELAINAQLTTQSSLSQGGNV